LTVASELGIVGFVAYVLLLASAARVLMLVVRHVRGFGLGLAAAFLFLFVHSLFYSGFFEDPMTWGILALSSAALAVRPAPVTAREAAAAGVEPLDSAEPSTAS
jgi:hypothetical protein